jgi:hypothetical protein
LSLIESVATVSVCQIKGQWQQAAKP